MKELLKKVKSHNSNADLKLIEEAHDFAKEAHQGQKRKSGEDFFTHVYEVANILADMRLDSNTIIAAFLHDVLEDTKTKPSVIKEKFGQEVLDLIEGVTKIDNIDVKDHDEFSAENIRKILLATSKDIRVILIKLADRLHNMRTLKHMPEAHRIRISTETLEIYAPIAHKLGMNKIKSELEDLSLRYLEPEIYQDIKKRVSDKKETRLQRMKDFKIEVEKKLEEHKINGSVFARTKTFYSIYRKIVKRKVPFEEIADLLAVRIIVDSVEDCYRVLGIIHSAWKYYPNKFADYIANPKPNGYQSIHTKILYQDRVAEIQIRTKEMHKEAEEGIAAHWRYKGTERDKKFDQKIAWLREILEWKQESDQARDLIETLKIDLFKDEIIVFTPKGDPISLREESTPIDFAYAIHSNLGNITERAKVNGHLVSLDYSLKSGDIVEIITRKNSKPSRNWLSIVKTSKARSKIRQMLGIHVDEKKKSTMEEFRNHVNSIADEVIVKGIKKPNLKFSRCCGVEFGVPITGFKTKDNKIAIHRTDCFNLDSMDAHRRIEVTWKGTAKQKTKKIKVIVDNRIGMLADLLNTISEAEINLASVSSKIQKGHVVLTLTLQTQGVLNSTLEELYNKIKYLPGVKDLML